MIQDLLYELEYYIYFNSEVIFGVAIIILFGAIAARFVKRGPLSKKTAITLVGIAFLLAGAVCFVESYWFSVEEIIAEIAALILPISVVYVAIISGRKTERRKVTLKPVAGRVDATTSRIEERSLQTGGVESGYGVASALINTEPARIDAKQWGSRSMDSAWDNSTFKCSACGETLLSRSRFCYKCGVPTFAKVEMILNGKPVSIKDM